MKTIKQIADALGVDKQRVYRYIKKNHINEAHQEAGMMYYDEAVETLIQSQFLANSASSEAHQTTSSDVAIDVLLTMLQRDNEALHHELEIKNKQIEDLSAALVSAQQTAAAAQALHAGTMQKQLTDGQSFWRKLFTRNKGVE